MSTSSRWRRGRVSVLVERRHRQLAARLPEPDKRRTLQVVLDQRLDDRIGSPGAISAYSRW
jgi:hypothetical protein